MLSPRRWALPSGERDHRRNVQAGAPLGPVGRPRARPPRGTCGSRRRSRDHRARDADGAARKHRAPAARDAPSARVRAPEPGHEPLLRGRQARDLDRGTFPIRRAPAASPSAPPCAHRVHPRDRESRGPRRPAGRVHRDRPVSAGRAPLHDRGKPHPPPRDRRGEGAPGDAPDAAPGRAARADRAAPVHTADDRRPRDAPPLSRRGPRAGRSGVIAPAAVVRAGVRGPSLVRALQELLGASKVLGTRDELLVYEYDGAVDTATPDAVALPESTADVALLAKYCHEHDVPIVPRGAGTGLSGGAIPVEGGVVVSFAHMARILEIDVPNMRAVVQPGVVNLHLENATSPLGLHFVPDPSSQKACTIGGNVAENSGGPHTLAYGVTTNHVTGLEIVLSDGTVTRIGGKREETRGYDLVGAFVGSEGTLGVVTEATVKLTPLPEEKRTLMAAFATMDDASETVSAIIGAGIVPSAIEMMDQLATQAVEASVHAGYPLDAGGI